MLRDKLKGFNIILASQSPRRQELLTAMGVSYTLAPKYEVEEVCPDGISSNMEAIYLSEKKSILYPAPLSKSDILITADTLVVSEERVYGKPTNREEAIDFLSNLSGRKHRVITGVTLRCGDIYHTFSESTDVTFSELSASEIIYYVETYTPYDKAGAYAIQEWIGAVGISSINGTYFNIMGLPTAMLYKELNNFIDKLNY